jgi:hypothetical protein
MTPLYPFQVGDQVRIITSRRRIGDSHRTGAIYEVEGIPKEKQRVGTVIKLHSRVKQMTILTQNGKVKFWFHHQCEIIV